MNPTITAFERSPDGGKGLARDTRVNQFILPSYELVDATAALAINEHVTVTLYGKNLTNEAYSNNANGNATFRSQFLYPGRTWLAEIALRF